MAQPVIQTSFNAGEWAPALNARVDLTKYHSGAALLRNFFVDYRGGATTRPGSKYILQCRNSALQVRLIPFSASFNVNYLLEFGHGYIRFFVNQAPILEPGVSLTNVTTANPAVFTTSAPHGYAVGDWIFVFGIIGPSQLNGNYYIVASTPTGSTFTLVDLFSVPVSTVGQPAYSSGGTVQRVFQISTLYLSTELSQIKFTQNVNNLIICHPNHPPQQLVLGNSPTSWTIGPITFGATISPPAGPTASSTLGAGTVNYAYVVTSVDSNGQESAVSPFASLTNLLDLRSTAGSNTVTWTAVAGAVSYNIYKAEPRYSNPVPAGAQFGFVGNQSGVTFIDSNITPDFSQAPPIVQNPFSGAGVASVAMTSGGGNYAGLAVPAVGFSGGAPTTPATAIAVLGVTGITIANGGTGYVVNTELFISGAGGSSNGITVLVTATGAFGVITAFQVLSFGITINSGTVPANPRPSAILAGSGDGTATFNLTWAVQQVQITSPGAGYGSVPTVTFSTGTAAATAALGASSSGNPTVPSFFQQRLIFAAPPLAPNQFNMSQPGLYFNYNVTNPVAGDNAIQGSLVSGKLNLIRSMVSMPSGLVMLTDQQAWLINGGSAGSAVSAVDIVANSQAYNGASDLPPIVANYDILYVQAKTSIVRDLSYNFYTNVYAGVNISTLSSHLFFGFTLLEWCWAEEPFKIVWAVRSDGDLLSLTFQKDQEMIAWAHHDTNGLYKSIATITELGSSGYTDAVYVVVQRMINGVSVQYIERFVDLIYPQGYKSSWQVDAGIGYIGSPATTFSGASHLSGQAVTGVADGAVINFTMPTSGIFVFGPGGTPGLTGIASASVVTVGLAFTPQLQTLALDLGEPTVQGKRKKISAVGLMINNTLGLSVGKTFGSLVLMKDLVLGNVSTMLTGQPSQIVTDLVSGYARTILDPTYDVPGQFCFQQNQPYPATILGLLPEIEIGDTPK